MGGGCYCNKKDDDVELSFENAEYKTIEELEGDESQFLKNEPIHIKPKRINTMYLSFNRRMSTVPE